MKENSELINDSIFNHFPPRYSHKTRNTISTRQYLKTRILTFKSHLLSGAASLGIGAVFLLGIYLFFSQLAEYGW